MIFANHANWITVGNASKQVARRGATLVLAAIM
jgi:hypothetical protein